MYLERQNSRPSGVIRGIATERVLVRPPAGRVPTAPPRARLPAGATWLASPSMAAALGGARVLATDKTGTRYCKPVVNAHGDDLRGRLGGDAQDVYPAADVFDDEERERSRRFCLLLRCALLAATLNRSEEHADPETEDSQVEDHLHGDDEAGGLGGRGDVSEADRGEDGDREVQRVGTGERIDVEVVGVGLLHHEVRGREEKKEHRHGDGSASIARTAECRCRMIARTW